MNKKNLNVGISLLKILMCFEVIICHFYANSEFLIAEPFYFIRKYAVPTFIFISFYFLARNMFNQKSGYLPKRIKKLYYPLLMWALIYYFIYRVILHHYRGITFKDLLWQILTGHSEIINTAMWFQVVLIMLTITFYFIFKFVKGNRNRFLKFCVIVGCLALLFQYTEINYNVFCHLRFELRYPLGRFIEMLPPAALAIIVLYLNIYEKLLTRRKIYIILFPIICIIMKLISKYTVRIYGFGYQGIEMTIFAFCIVGFFYLTGISVYSSKLIKFINQIASCTLGIYCMHMLIGSLILELLSHLQIVLDDFIVCILIFIVSYIISRLLYMSSSGYIRNLVS